MNFGVAAMLTQLAIILYGMPHQLWRIAETKQVAGMSVPFYLLMWMGSVFYAVHSFKEKRNWYVFVPQIFAVPLGAALVVCIIYYQ